MLLFYVSNFGLFLTFLITFLIVIRISKTIITQGDFLTDKFDAMFSACNLLDWNFLNVKFLLIKSFLLCPESILAPDLNCLKKIKLFMTFLYSCDWFRKLNVTKKFLLNYVTLRNY